MNLGEFGLASSFAVLAAVANTPCTLEVAAQSSVARSVELGRGPVSWIVYSPVLLPASLEQCSDYSGCP